jgi:predicted transcriptional regulator
MKVVFDEKASFWKVEAESKKHSLKTNDFLVLTSLMDKKDRRFHHVSELIFSSNLDDMLLKEGLQNLRKTSLVQAKGNYYRISDIGEKVVSKIRNNEVDVVNENNIFLDVLKRFFRLEAK